MPEKPCHSRLECAYVVASSLIFFRGPASYHDITSFAYIAVTRGLIQDYWGDWRAVAGAVESPSLLIDIGRLLRKGLLATTIVDEYGVYVEKITLPGNRDGDIPHLLLLDGEAVYLDAAGYAYRLFRATYTPVISA